jgi:hypothetical protein
MACLIGSSYAGPPNDGIFSRNYQGFGDRIEPVRAVPAFAANYELRNG